MSKVSTNTLVVTLSLSKGDSGPRPESPFDRLRVTTFLFVVFLLFSHLSTAQTLRPTTFDDRNICEDSKGVWRQFGNGCANNCESAFDKFAMCTQSLVFACDCGKNRCWNGEACTALKDYKKIYDIEAAKNQKILDAAKEKRKADSLANEQEIMARLNPPDPNAPKPAEPAPAPTPKKPELVIVQPVVVDPEAPTSPITQIAAPEPVNQEPVKVEIPPFLLKKQAQEEAKKAEEAKKVEEKKKSESSKSVIIDGSLPPGLPVIPLPN